MARNDKPARHRRQADSVHRQPRDEETPTEHGLPVRPEDAPKGQPNSDRFLSEQAHQAVREEDETA